MWRKSWFRDANLGLGSEPKDNTTAILTSSMTLVSMIQISNISTLLIIPVVLMQKQISANFLAAIVLSVGITNFIFVNDARQYHDAENR